VVAMVVCIPHTFMLTTWIRTGCSSYKSEVPSIASKKLSCQCVLPITHTHARTHTPNTTRARKHTHTHTHATRTHMRAYIRISSHCIQCIHHHRPNRSRPWVHRRTRAQPGLGLGLIKFTSAAALPTPPAHPAQSTPASPPQAT
jgi:hypothetical protein